MSRWGKPWLDREPEPEPIVKTPLQLAREKALREIEGAIADWQRGAVPLANTMLRVRQALVYEVRR